MKKWITGFAVLMLGFVQLSSAQVVSADSLDDIRQQQEQKQRELDSLQSNVAQALQETSELTIEIDSLNAEISETEETIQKKEAEVKNQEAIVKARLEQASARLQALQKNEANNNVVMAIFEAESLTELLSRTLLIVQLTDAGNQHIEDAQAEADKLAELQAQLVAEQEILEENLQEISEQKAAYDEKVAALQSLVKENQSELTQLESREADEEARIEEARQAAREEAIKAAEELAAAERASAEQVVSTSSSVSDSSTVEAAEPATTSSDSDEPASNSAPKKETEQKAETPAKSGRTIQVSATGYSTQQPNLGSITATGIDLRVNPRVVAVDPSVIPLGAMVEIPGKGVYIAGDTGSAIKGNKIDIHYPTVSEAFAWGRRTITIKILD